MMNANSLTYSLNFSGFSIDFDVKIDSSIQETKAYRLPANIDFVFAVADTWLWMAGVRHLLVSDFNTGNLIELLRNLEQRLCAQSLSHTLEGVIERCGWGAWMHGYWDRLNNDASTVDDDAIYDLLIPMSLLEGHEGHIAAYNYNGTAVIEAATRPKIGVPIFVCSDFEPGKVAAELEQMRLLVEAAIRARL